MSSPSYMTRRTAADRGARYTTAYLINVSVRPECVTHKLHDVDRVRDGGRRGTDRHPPAAAGMSARSGSGAGKGRSCDVNADRAGRPCVSRPSSAPASHCLSHGRCTEVDRVPHEPPHAKMRPPLYFSLSTPALASSQPLHEYPLIV